jgi:hypothetical protein
MLHSIAFFYWMLDRYVSQSGPLFLVVIAALPLIYSTFQAVTDRPLSRGTRLGLSLWSAVVMAALAIRYAVAVLQFGSIEPHLERADFGGAARIFIEFLLLGAAGATITQNLMMLLGYLPSRNTTMKKYAAQVRELCQAHVERFSKDQVPRGQAWVAMILALVSLVTNWNLRVVSTGFVMWFLVAGVPWIMEGWTWWSATRRGPLLNHLIHGRVASSRDPLWRAP